MGLFRFRRHRPREAPAPVRLQPRRQRQQQQQQQQRQTKCCPSQEGQSEQPGKRGAVSGANGESAAAGELVSKGMSFCHHFSSPCRRPWNVSKSVSGKRREHCSTGWNGNIFAHTCRIGEGHYYQTSCFPHAPLPKKSTLPLKSKYPPPRHFPERGHPRWPSKRIKLFSLYLTTFHSLFLLSLHHSSFHYDAPNQGRGRCLLRAGPSASLLRGTGVQEEGGRVQTGDDWRSRKSMSKPGCMRFFLSFVLLFGG